MSYDTSWISKRIIPGGYGFTREFVEGVEYFLTFTKNNSKDPDNPELLIRCPCNTCRNQLYQLIKDVEFHLYATGFLESYTIWHYHEKENEEMNASQDVYDEYEILRDAFRGEDFGEEISNHEDPNEQASKLASVLSLPDQLELFKEYIGKLKAWVGEERTDYIIANSIYFVVAGTDDLLNTYFLLGARRLHYDVPSYADFVVSYASSFTQELYNLGARRIAVFGAPPIGCVPSQRTLAGGLNRDCVKTYNQAAQVYNSKLSSELETLGNTLPQSKIVYIDIYNPLLHLIQNPQNYDLEVVDRGCCGTGLLEVTVLCNKFSSTCPDHTKYLFWDSYHPTETGYKLLVDKVLGRDIVRFF